jgi:hypothetical protein
MNTAGLTVPALCGPNAKVWSENSGQGDSINDTCKYDPP